MLSQLSSLNVAYAVRYADCTSLDRPTDPHLTHIPLSVAFAVAAVQYCLRTLALERRVVWHAPRSFAKYAYLIGKYMPILDCALIFVPLSGFWGTGLTNEVREPRPSNIYA
jgi:hypothetical protein